MSNFSLGVCLINLYIPESQSLKMKRSVVKSLKDKIKRQFPVSIAEVGNGDLWQSVDFAIGSTSVKSPL